MGTDPAVIALTGHDMTTRGAFGGKTELATLFERGQPL
jgi:hypothetical protein